MLENLRDYLSLISDKLSDKEDGELLMEEISKVAINNFIDREDGDPVLTREQIISVLHLVLIRKNSAGLN